MKQCSIPIIKWNEKKEIFSLSILLFFNLAKREAREHLGLNEGPIPSEVRHRDDLLYDPEKPHVFPTAPFFEKSSAELDSLFNRPPGRHHRLHDMYVKREQGKRK